MEHFRWGKPVGRKRRPVKVYTSNGVAEESAEVFPEEMRRRELTNQLLAEQGEKAQEMVEEAEEEQQLLNGVQEKKDGSYKMKHFRWSGPPTSKRYGGFMKSWDEHSQRPLLTLFKNVINKEGQQQKWDQTRRGWGSGERSDRRRKRFPRQSGTKEFPLTEWPIKKLWNCHLLHDPDWVMERGRVWERCFDMYWYM